MLIKIKTITTRDVFSKKYYDAYIDTKNIKVIETEHLLSNDTDDEFAKNYCIRLDNNLNYRINEKEYKRVVRTILEEELKEEKANELHPNVTN